MFGKISYTLGPIPPHAVWEGVLEKDSMWCYPEPGSYKMRLRDVCDFFVNKNSSFEFRSYIADLGGTEIRTCGVAVGILEIKIG